MMRDVELMVALLREMSDDEAGVATPTRAKRDQIAARTHHSELLVDAGHAEWRTEARQLARITNDGYDLLNAIDREPKAADVFFTAIRGGVPYLHAARAAGATAARIALQDQ